MANTETGGVPAPTLDELLRLRLALVPATPAPHPGFMRSEVARDLAPLFAEGGASASAWRERFDGAVGRRTAAGEVFAPKRGRLALTDAGRAALGDENTAAPGASWVAVRDGLLVARALGHATSGGTGETGPTAPLGADALRAAILLQRFAPDAPRPARPPTTLAEAVNLLVTRAVRARRGTPGELRAALLRGWLAPTEAAGNNNPSPLPIIPTDLPAFAAAVLDAARRCPGGRLGETKIFIAAVWRYLQSEGHPFAGSVPGDSVAFKQRLGEANATGLLRLSRADLAETGSADLVAASEVQWLGATFHLLRLN